MLTPQENPHLTGHNVALEGLKKAVDAKHLPHSLIVNGAHGIGKATFIFHLIRYALGGEINADDPVFKKIAAGSHPNVLLVTPAYDEKKQRYKSTLTVDEAHKVGPFFRQTSVDGAWRFVVIDQAHTMNRNAQNAILKILEEPPANSTIFLISENSGAFLPTIRSRCQMMQLDPLTEKEIANELQAHFTDLSEVELATYARIAQGSLGDAFTLIDMEALTIVEDLEQAGMSIAQNQESQAMKFCEEYGHTSKDREYSFIQQFLNQEITQTLHAKISNDGATLSQWQSHLFNTKGEGELVAIHDKVSSVFQTAEASFLDRKLVLLNALQAMR